MRTVVFCDESLERFMLARAHLGARWELRWVQDVDALPRSVAKGDAMVLCDEKVDARVATVVAEALRRGAWPVVLQVKKWDEMVASRLLEVGVAVLPAVCPWSQLDLALARS